jgi:hypothetical protein
MLLEPTLAAVQELARLQNGGAVGAER